ncbi:hypothetical protein Slin15195_G108210 [Septoria linicola]|uniref:Uncharacterized protein n=1 Tax=Septoria linicola TaxID=215465 RepID=A0A9Q9AX23_9PEZI|nr:hypothetical protein Slin15195_G108210 [Septoria linicola]
MSAMDRQIEQELQDSANRPINILRRSIEAGHASSHGLRLCLKAQFDDQRRYSRAARPKVHEGQREDQLARTYLTYLLQDPEQWTEFLRRETDTVDDLCYFAVIEGLQDSVLQWLQVPLKDRSHPWRTNVASSIGKAQSLLDTTNSADLCLILYFKMEAMFGQRRVE